jgi:hypothetical protein
MSLTAFEAQRGSVLQAAEMPVQVGKFLVQEVEADRSEIYLRWKHLKRGFDTERLWCAGALVAVGVFLFLVARALGWIIDGFVTRPLPADPNRPHR